MLNSPDIPANFGTLKMARTMGRIIELGANLSVGDIAADNPWITNHDVAQFWDSYMAYEAELMPEDHEFHEAVAGLFERYDTEFKAAIKEHRRSMQLIGHGGSSWVYRMDYKGASYAVRFPLEAEAEEGEKGSVAEIDKHVEATLLVSDIDNMERVVAASYLDKITVSPLVEGRGLFHLGSLTLDQISEEQLAALYGSMKQAEERGVGFDFKGDNLLYDSDKGFTIIDLGTIDDMDQVGANEALAVLVRYMTEDTLKDDLGAEHARAVARIIDHIAVLARDSAAGSESFTSIQHSREELLDYVNSSWL